MSGLNNRVVSLPNFIVTNESPSSTTTLYDTPQSILDLDEFLDTDDTYTPTTNESANWPDLFDPFIPTRNPPNTPQQPTIPLPAPVAENPKPSILHFEHIAIVVGTTDIKRYKSVGICPFPFVHKRYSETFFANIETLNNSRFPHQLSILFSTSDPIPFSLHPLYDGPKCLDYFEIRFGPASDPHSPLYWPAHLTFYSDHRQRVWQDFYFIFSGDAFVLQRYGREIQALRSIAFDPLKFS